MSLADLLLQQTQHPEPALAVLDEGMNKLGMIPQLQQRAIELERQAERHAKARQRLLSLQAMLGESPRWQVDLAELYLQDQKTDAAHALLDQARNRLLKLRKTPSRLAVLQRIDELLTTDNRSK
ncbi:MAG: hypothetical protein R3E95_02090 [Thiolinea sp.]